MLQENNSEKSLVDRQTLIRGGRLHWFHWLIIGLSLALTIVAWLFSKEMLNQKVEAQFEREAEQVVQLVKERMELYENALWSSVAFIDSNKTINHTQWLDYASSLDIDLAYPGINGIGVIYNIKQNQLASYLEQEKKLRPDYTIHPEHNESEYWPITYIEPSNINKKAIGLDMAFENNRYSSIKRARDSGKAQITGPITLVQDAQKTPGFLFYAPFYKNGEKPKTMSERRQKIVGVTYAPFIMSKLIDKMLANLDMHVAIRISDVDTLLFDATLNETNDASDPNPLFDKKMDVDMYGRNWQFDIRSNLSFRQAASSNQPSFILAGGLIIDSLLLVLFLLLSRTNRQALAYADNATKELVAKAADLEKSNQDLEQFSYIASHDLKSPLNAIKQLVGWIEEDCQDILPNDSKKHLTLLKARTERMMKLLSDLLEYSRISRIDKTQESVNLDSMTKNVFEMLGNPSGFSYSAPNIDLNLSALPFDIVLRNLISNSIKHHDKESGNIIIEHTNQQSFHEFKIKDDGPGIPEEFHDKVFEMFQTMQPRDQVEGSGMGLAIVKKIVEHHGGHLTLSATLPRGVQFTLMWPIS